jgi:kynureninase
VNSPRAADRRGGAVTLDVPHGLAVARAMIAKSIIVDYREGGGIRIAPHFYTRDDELTDAIETMKEIIEGRIFTTYLNASGVVS